MSSIIFISHSSKDKEYGDAIVELLLNVGVNNKQIVYTSNPNTGVLAGSNIYDYLRNKILKRAYIVYLLSNNYYNSVACLNEMGAAWMVESDYDLIATPEFNMGDEKFQGGVIDSRKLVVSMDNETNIKQFVLKVLKNSNIDVDNIKISTAIQDYLLKLHEIESCKKTNKEININLELRINGLGYKDTDFVKLGDDLREEGNKGISVIQQYLYAIYLNPKCESAYVKIIQEETIRGNYDRANNICDFAFKQFPNSASIYGSYGYLKYGQGEYQKAVDSCSKAISLNEDRWYYNTRGRAFLRLNKLYDALVDFWHSQKCDPSYDPAIKNLHNVCDLIGENKILEEALKQKEGDRELCKIYLQCILIFNGENKEALKELKKLEL